MNRAGHRYVKPVRTTTAPTRIVVVVPSHAVAYGHQSPRAKYLRGDKAYAAYSRRIGVRWTRPRLADGLDPDLWWDWHDGLVAGGSRLWVIAPVASDALTLLGFWKHTDGGRYRVYDPGCPSGLDTTVAGTRKRPWVGRLVLRGQPDIVSYRAGCGSVQWVSISNYTVAPWADLANACGMQWDDGRDVDAGGIQHLYDPGLTRSVLLATVQRLISEWVAEDCGPWRETAGQLVVSLWRKRFYSSRVCRHADELATEIESAALHGGRASCWYYGDVGHRDRCPGPPYDPPEPSPYGCLDSMAHRLDVTSQYPSLLRDQFFPTRLIDVRENLQATVAESLARHRGIIATVTAQLRHSEYPVKRAGRTLYPLGTTTLTVAGPELARLLAEDSVIVIHRAAIYDMGRPFRELCDYLLTRRQLARDSGNTFLELLFKTWANAFGGKFAQRSSRWELRPDIPPQQQWGEWRRLPSDGIPEARFRALAGVTWEHVEGTPGARLLAAVFAYLTSYGRVMMRDIREQTPARTVFSQDTDGLWIADAGFRALETRHNLGQRVPGTLRTVESVAFARWYSPRHYYTPGQWVLSGVCDGFQVTSRDTVKEVRYTNPVRFSPRRAPKLIASYAKTYRLSNLKPPDRVGPDGWALPPVLHGSSYESTDRV